MSIQAPFFIFNPKSYLFGDRLIELAQTVEELANEYPELTVAMSAPATQLARVKPHLNRAVLCAQHMDPIEPGPGMGAIFPESLVDIGVEAVFLNHAEHPMNFSELTQAIEACDQHQIQAIACANSTQEAQALAQLSPAIILCEPTDLIGTGQTSSDQYVQQTTDAIRQIDDQILVMQAAGITTADDVYQLMRQDVDGTGCTSGITEADDPAMTLRQMVAALAKATAEKSIN